MSKVVVLGAGQWGTTMAQVLCDAGNHVLMWGRSQELVDEVNEKHTNSKYLDDNVLPVGLKATTDLREAFEYSKASFKLVVAFSPTGKMFSSRYFEFVCFSLTSSTNSWLRPHIKTWFPASHRTCAMVVPHWPAPRTTTLLTSSWPS